LRSSRRNQDSTPFGEASVGNEAFNFVLKEGFDGDKKSIRRSSRLGWAFGMWIASGARKMAFSTFDNTGAASRRHSRAEEKSRGESIV
jgi:hypothetical protein